MYEYKLYCLYLWYDVCRAIIEMNSTHGIDKPIGSKWFLNTGFKPTTRGFLYGFGYCKPVPKDIEWHCQYLWGCFVWCCCCIFLGNFMVDSPCGIASTSPPNGKSLMLTIFGHFFEGKKGLVFLRWRKKYPRLAQSEAAKNQIQQDC